MAEQTLDVYRDWIGIKETARPLNHYQLLRLKTFEDDVAKIRENYRKLNAHVRKYSTGKYGTESQQLLNELAKAMLCLTDARRKREYDASLGRKHKQEGLRSLEEILLARKVVDTEQLNKARKFADVTGLEVREAMVQQKIASPDVVGQAYAESIGLPFLKLSEVDIDNEELLRKVPAVLARQNACVPVLIDEGQLLIASPNPISPDIEEELRLRNGLGVRTVLCTPTEVNQALDKYYSQEAAQAELKANVVSSGGGPATERTPEEEAAVKKELRNVALLTFNFTFMAIVVVQSLREQPFWTSTFPVAVAVAGAVAGTAYVVVSNKRR